MRHFFLLAGLLPMTAGCFALQFEHTRTVQQTIEPDTLRSIDLSTYNGSIEIKPHDAPNVEMEITYKAHGVSEDAAKENCESLECVVSEDDGKLTIKATKPSSQWSASVSFILQVPPDSPLTLSTSNGSVSVKDIAAKVRIKTSNGSIRCERLQGPLVAETSNGAIQVQDSESSVQLKTSNGKVAYSGRLVGDRNEFRTSNGSVTITVPTSGSTEVLAKTSNGRIDCDLPTRRVLEENKKSLHVIAGEGQEENSAVKLSVQTSNGSIKINALSGELASEDRDSDLTEGELVL